MRWPVERIPRGGSGAGEYIQSWSRREARAGMRDAAQRARGLLMEEAFDNSGGGRRGWSEARVKEVGWAGQGWAGRSLAQPRRAAAGASEERRSTLLRAAWPIGAAQSRVGRSARPRIGCASHIESLHVTCSPHDSERGRVEIAAEQVFEAYLAAQSNAAVPQSEPIVR